MKKGAQSQLRSPALGALKPHQEERFVPYIMSAELAVLQVATADTALSDEGVREAIGRLVRLLKHSGPLKTVLDAESARALGRSARDEVARWIMRNLSDALAEHGALPLSDIVGVLGTVKSSAGTWSQGPRSHAYLDYLRDFFGEMGVIVVADEAAAAAPPAQDPLD